MHPEPDFAAQQRSANALGVILGLVALGILVTSIACFTAYGLPKDPDIVRKQSRSATTAQSPGEIRP